MQKEQISVFNWLVTEVQVAYSLFAHSCEFQSIKQKFMFLSIKTTLTENVISAFGDLSDMKVCFEFMPGDRVRKLTEIAESMRKTQTSKMHSPLTHKYTRVGPSWYMQIQATIFIPGLQSKSMSQGTPRAVGVSETAGEVVSSVFSE